MKYPKLFHWKTSSFFCGCRITKAYSNTAAVVRVRFAPSPTGYLHIGGLRTALYNYLFAKSKGGSFILRIEDTDQARLVEGSVEKLENDLKWVGLIPDEGPSAGGSYGPYFQSQRLDLYRKEINNLLASKKAYYCFCSERRLDLIRKDALKRREIPKYDNLCRNLTDEQVAKKLNTDSSFCVRFKLTPFLEPWNDLIYGSITHNVAETEGDPIILKNDGFPTYHLANVVDDHYMKISHVLRGVEWQISTAKHLLLYKAFNWNPPAYAHLPLLLNEDGTKLSKRNNGMTVEAYRKDGTFPRALLNFLTLCGGGFLRSVEPKKLRSLKSLVETFSLDLICVKNCQVPFDRIKEFNRAEYTRLVSDEGSLNELVEVTRNTVIEYFSPENIPQSMLEDKTIKEILKNSIKRITKVTELVGPNFRFIWNDPLKEVVLMSDSEMFEYLPLLIERIQGLEKFDESFTVEFLKQFAAENGLKYAPFMRFMRRCLSGLKDGPGVVEMALLLGKSTAIRRLKNASLFYNSSKKEKMVT